MSNISKIEDTKMSENEYLQKVKAENPDIAPAEVAETLKKFRLKKLRSDTNYFMP